MDTSRFNQAEQAQINAMVEQKQVRWLSWRHHSVADATTLGDRLYEHVYWCGRSLLQRVCK